MNPEDWQRVEAIFEAALERPPAERPALVERLCAGDDDLRRTVETLLRSDAEEDHFLRDAVGSGIELLEQRPEDQLRVGPYRLLRRLGIGGMGEVFLAERDDREYRQEVALKLVRPGLDSARIVERFRRERQILAGLEHPNIARLLDGGTTDDGKPYFVMEAIAGEPIDRYCDRLRLDINRRLELFRTVCSAVRFAHQHLIVHRDLKPSNILITDDGTVKLLDFGIAKLLVTEDDVAETELTLATERPLTLGYASPEQVRGEPVTAASDVYALGCLAYRLLTGRLPFELTGLPRRDAEKIILEHDPLPLSVAISRLRRDDPATAAAIAEDRRTRVEALRRRLSGELDAIVLGCLRKERDRRPGSAAELAEDVRRYTKGLPVRAHRDSLAYRTRKFVGRNRLSLVLAGLFLLILGSAFVNNQLQARRVAQERDKALVVANYLVDLFSISDPSRSRGDTVTARELLDRGARDIARELDDQPLVQAMLSDTIGRVYRQLGLHEQARPLIERALAVRRQELGENHADVAWSLTNLGGVEYDAGNYQEAAKHHDEALGIYRRLSGDQRADVAEASSNLALALMKLGHNDRAESLLRDSLDLHRALSDGDSASVATTLSNLGLLLAARGETAAARDLTREALEIGRRELGEPHPEVATYLNNLAAQLQDLGDYAAAEPVYREALEMRRQVLDTGHRDILQTLNNLAGLHYHQGDYPQAEALFRDAAEMIRETLGENHPEVANYLSNLAVVRQAQGDYGETEELLRQALAIRRQALGEEHPAVAQSLDSLASLLVTVGDYAAAEPLYERALELSRAARGEEHPNVIQTLCNLARLRRYRDDFGAGVPAQERCLALRLSVLGADHPSVALGRSHLAELHAAAGDPEAATALYRLAVEQQRRLLGADHPQLAASLTGLAETLTALGALDEADAILAEAVGMLERSLPDGHWRIAAAHSVLGGLRAAQGRLAEAGPLLRESHNRLEALRGAHHYATRAARARLETHAAPTLPLSHPLPSHPGEGRQPPPRRAPTPAVERGRSCPLLF